MAASEEELTQKHGFAAYRRVLRSPRVLMIALAFVIGKL